MFSPPDVALIVVVALLIFGPGKLPELGKSLGKGIKDFKKAIEDSHDPEDEKVVKELADYAQVQSSKDTKENA